MQGQSHYAELDEADDYSRVRLRGAGLLLLRATAGGFLLPHGLGKLLGWFGGPGLSGFTAELQGFDLPSFAPVPLVLALLQTSLAVLLILGAWTRRAALVASLYLAITAVITANNGWFWMTHGMEYPLLWALVLFALALTGSRPFSIDSHRARQLRLDDQGLPNDR